MTSLTRFRSDGLWAQAAAAGTIDPRAVTTGLFLQSLNETIDLPTKRLAALQNRIPEVVIFLLFFGGILAVGVVGYGYGLGARRNTVLMTAFCVLIALVVLVIIDLDRPRRGLITISQQSMQDLRESLDRSKPWNAQGFWDPYGGSWLYTGSREARSPIEQGSSGLDDGRLSIITAPGETRPFRCTMRAQVTRLCSYLVLPLKGAAGTCPST